MPTATSNLSALEHNLSVIRGYLKPETRVLAAVKANAYGHGAVPVAKHLLKQGVDWLGVATRDEALELRQAGIDADMLIFSPVYDGLAELIAQDVALSVVDRNTLDAIQRAAGEAGKHARVHLKVDTGMGRLGLPAQESLDLAEAADRARNVTLEGLWTHFSCADEAEREFTEQQLERFQDVVTGLERRGIEVPLKHAANSSAVIAYPESHFDMVRPGIALYGHHSSEVIEALEPRLEPVLTLSATVTFVKRVQAGHTVSYGAMWRAPHETTVVTLRIGYADGYPRHLANRGRVNVNGELRTIAGRVCMDQLMVDVGDLDVQVGQQVIMFGPEGPTAEEVGRLAGTISYEMLTSLGRRVARVYQD